jgi:RecJ-like exonuclease
MFCPVAMRISTRFLFSVRVAFLLAGLACFTNAGSMATEQAAVPVVSPGDLAKARELVDKSVALEGTVVAQSASKTETVRYLNFTQDYRQSVSLVFFTKDNESFNRRQLETYVGKRIRVTGKLTEHDGAVQMIVMTLAQIEVIP